MNKDDKLKALDAAITQIEKSYGKGSIMKLGDSGANMNIETVPTGSISLDIALGLGGVPKGRVIEIYGPESSGKTTVALHMVEEYRCGHRQPLHFPAGQRRAGAGDYRDHGPLRCSRHCHRGLCCSPGTKGRDRRRDG